MRHVLSHEVETVLRDFPQTRDDDVALLVRVWKEFYGVTFERANELFALLKALPREDTVKRIRAAIQNDEGKYLPTKPEVLAKRQGTKKDAAGKQEFFATH